MSTWENCGNYPNYILTREELTKPWEDALNLKTNTYLSGLDAFKAYSAVASVVIAVAMSQ